MWTTFWVLLGFTAAWISGLICLIWRYRSYPEYKATLDRCEKQHAALMRGNDRVGFYGSYPPADLS